MLSQRSRLISRPILAQNIRNDNKTAGHVLREVLTHAKKTHPADKVWTTLITEEALMKQIQNLEAFTGEARKRLPLYGIPFAVKDNIDVKNFPTTNGLAKSSAFLHAAGRSNNLTESAYVVQRLEAAGAVCIGKTNMDQLATGLVGVRSPYGAPSSVFNSDYISGGSSSGSGVAVAGHMVSFSLGTDTAGSGRVPASYGNIVGVKPSLGLLSSHGVAPACRSLDTISIFALTAMDANIVLQCAAGYNQTDPFSKAAKSRGGRVKRSASGPTPGLFRVAVPRKEQVEFFQDKLQQSHVWEQGLEQLKAAGAEIIEIDYSPFQQAARLLYEGPWVAERYAANRELVENYKEDVDLTVYQIIKPALGLSAVSAFESQYKLKELRRKAEAVWEIADVIATPTVGAHYTKKQILSDPVKLNSNLGYYTNHMNLFDLCALAVPIGFTPKETLPFGITLAAPAFHDTTLLEIAALLEQQVLPNVGGGKNADKDPLKIESGKLSTTALDEFAPLPETPTVSLAVCGAHMKGLPLNWQLAKAGARLLAATKTSPKYKLVSFDKMSPPRPGLVVASLNEQGGAIEVEVWEIPTSSFGEFVKGVANPLSIGYVELEDGQIVQGFRCDESSAFKLDGKDITSFGSWRNYCASREQ
eukprot:gb/GEZN01003861.1/.p1 GENE.gb/GEZN01003861.1/~~gb/GEZN01003861.1/.p1  ORF type:complete len:651 (-),score=59.55 gb/GEZN01003861.1/:125-2053(-)